MKKEILRFLLIGSTAVVIDMFFYASFIYIAIPSSISKGISFISGALFAYFFNRKYTFINSSKNLMSLPPFILLYLSSLMMNIFTNELVLSFFNRSNYYLSIAFIVATAVSATINFFGMKYIVFKK